MCQKLLETNSGAEVKAPQNFKPVIPSQFFYFVISFHLPSYKPSSFSGAVTVTQSAPGHEGYFSLLIPVSFT